MDKDKGLDYDRWHLATLVGCIYLKNNFIYRRHAPKVSDYDQEISQSHHEDQPTALRRRAADHVQSQGIRKTKYCKLGNFHEDFIFAKLRICEVA